jgi:Phospholipase_D-nuclease N-terminal
VRFLPWAVAIVLYVYCWLEIGQSDPREVRVLPRLLWALVVVVPFFGAAAWLIYGRPNGTGVREPSARPQRQVVAPDDDPEFLRSLRKRPPDNE